MSLNPPKIESSFFVELGIAGMIRKGFDSLQLAEAARVSKARFDRAAAGEKALRDDECDRMALIGTQSFDLYSVDEMIRRAKRSETLKALRQLRRNLRSRDDAYLAHHEKGHAGLTETVSSHRRKSKGVAELA